MKLRDNPCDRCGWKFPGDHCCIDLSTPAARAAAKRVAEDRRVGPMPESQRRSISEAKSEYWAAYRESNRKRDAEIIARYNMGGINQPQLSKDFGMSQSTVQKILKRAEDEGLTKVRRHGSNIRHGDFDIRMEASQ